MHAAMACAACSEVVGRGDPAGGSQIKCTTSSNSQVTACLAGYTHNNQGRVQSTITQGGNFGGTLVAPGGLYDNSKDSGGGPRPRQPDPRQTSADTCTAILCPSGSTGTVPGSAGTGAESGCTVKPGYYGWVVAVTTAVEAPGYKVFRTPGGSKAASLGTCQDYGDVLSIASCTSCTGPEKADCATGVCNDGYVNFNPTTGCASKRPRRGRPRGRKHSAADPPLLPPACSPPHAL